MVDKQVSVRLVAEGGGKLKAEFQGIGQEAQRAFTQVDRSSRSAGSGLQNVGFQIQDFAVQVAGGTDASRALAQQLPQLLSGFGLLGVAFGTAAAVALPLFAAFGLGADEMERLDGQMKLLAATTKEYDAAAAAASVSIGDLEKKYGDLADEVQRALKATRDLKSEEARSALSAVASGAGFEVDGAARLDVLRAKLDAMRDAMATTQAALTPGSMRFFDFSADMVAITQLIGHIDTLQQEYDGLADTYGITTGEAERLAIAQAALAAADGPVAQVEAADQLLQVMVEVFGSIEAAREATGGAGGLADLLLEAVRNGADLAATDFGNIWDGARGAGELALNLARAAAMAPGALTRQGDDERGSQRDGRRSAGEYRSEVTLDRLFGNAGRGAGGGGGGVSQAEREAARIYDQTRTAAEKYKIELEELNALHKAGHLDTETYNRAVKKLGEDLDKTGDLGKKAASAIRSAFDNLFDDPAEALKNLARQLAQMALYQQLATSMPNIFGAGGIIPLMNANGNAFDRGVVQAFASGGIVSSATMFPMRGGMGVMGEAGPEAIMPLTRVGGKLGVAAAGGSGANVKLEVHNYGGGEVQTQERRGPNGERLIRMMVGKDLASGQHDASLRSRFGNRPNPVKR